MIDSYREWYSKQSEEERIRLLTSYPEILDDWLVQKCGRDLSMGEKKKCFEQVLEMAKSDPSELEEMIPLIQILGYGSAWQDMLLKCPELEGELVRISSEVLNIVDIKTETVSYLPIFDHENELVQKYESVKDGISFTEIYDFVETCERSRNWCLAYESLSVLRFHVQVLCEKDWNSLIQISNQRKSAIMTHQIVMALDRDNKLKAALETENPLFDFDVLRTDFYMNQDHNVPGEETYRYLQQYIDLLQKMACDKDVWRETLRYFSRFPSRAPEFFYVLSKTARKLPEEQLLEIARQFKIEKKIEGEMPGIKYQSWEGWLLSETPSTLTDSWREFYQLIFDKWRDFMNDNSNLSLGYTFTVADKSVRFYVENIMNPENRRAGLQTCEEKINEIANQWFCSESEQIREYFRLRTIYNMLI